MDMQDQSQTEALAQGGNTQDPNAEFGTSQASGQGTSPAQEQGQTGFDPNAFNKLRSDHQATLGRLRALQAEQSRFMEERNTFTQREAELAARLERLESSLKGNQQPGKVDYDSMSRDELIQHLTDAGASEGEKRAWARFEKYMQDQKQAESLKQKEAEAAQEEERYQKRWEEVFSNDPEIDVEDLEKFMKQERIFDPVWAYTVKHRDLLTKQAEVKAEQRTVEKISANRKNFTEGPGKAGATPPSKPKLTDKASRLSYIRDRMKEGLNNMGEE